ncbi:MAG: sugar ABC transporter permease [Chloroflexi bacterium]|nr:sugar ABC transporter permease [Chloroflexota bacterium]
MTAKLTGLGREIWRNRVGYLFIAPGYLAFIAFMFLPLAVAIGLSFYKASFAIDQRQFVGLLQYERLFTNVKFQKALFNTIKYVLVVVPATVGLSLVISLLIHPRGIKAQSFYRGAFYLPAVAGGVILSVVWLWIFNPTFGLLNYLLGLVGIEPVLWLASTRYSFWAVSMVVLTFTLGQPIILFLAALANLNQDLLDASVVDGANNWQRTWYVTLPLLRPVILFVLATQTIGVFQVWETIYMLTEGGPSSSSTSLVFLIYQTAFIASKYGKASAIGVVLLILVAIVTLLQLRLWDRSEV